MLFQGFEEGSATILATLFPIVTLTTVANTWAHQSNGHGGSYHASITAGGEVRANISTSHKWVHFALKASTGGGLVPQFYVRAYLTSAVGCTIQFDADGYVRIYRGTGTLLATSAEAINRNIDHYFWAYINVANSGGETTLYMDGSSTAVVSYTGDNNNNASDGHDQIGIVRSVSSGNPAQIDDLAFFTVAEVSALGWSSPPTEELFVKRLPPSADDTIGLTPSTGADNYALVDEVPPVSTDYNSTTTPGTSDLYEHAGLGFTPTQIAAVKVSNYAMRDGTFTGVAGVIKSGGTTDTGSTQSTGAATAWSMREEYWAQDPNTAAEWDTAGVNAALFGGELS